MSEWISVDIEPDQITDFLCLMRYSGNGYGYAICTWLGHSGIDGVDGWSLSAVEQDNAARITHYQPLPEPPK